MDLKVDSNTCFVTDLDDTLFFEIDFLRSAYRSISHSYFKDTEDEIYNKMIDLYFKKENVFEDLIKKFPEKDLKMGVLLEQYRFHTPSISLKPGALSLLKDIRQKGGILGMITDGRGITQRNKINALGIGNLFNDILISEEAGAEKPSDELFLFFMNKYKDCKYIYLADNVLKDFISPRKLGWVCIGLTKTGNEVKREDTDVSDEYLPHIFIDSLDEINLK